jgi:hypothetical protein
MRTIRLAGLVYFLIGLAQLSVAGFVLALTEARPPCIRIDDGTVRVGPIRG